VLRAGAGWTSGAVGAATVSGAPASPVGRALAVREPVIIADLRRTGFAVRPSWLLHEHGVVSGIETVIGGACDPWGVLGAYARRPRAATPDDIDFLRVIAAALALAIDRDRLAAAVADAGLQAERRTRARITQMLHDEALQSLLAARHHLNLAVIDPGRRDSAVRARDGVSRAIRELRGAVGALHPVAIESSRLRDAIQAIAGHQARQGGFTVSFDLAIEPGEDCAPLLLSVIRELTANIAQHAGAREVRVILRAAGENLVLEVCDDGVGIAPGRLEAALTEGHIGLASVTRRVQALGGEVQVAAGRGGTCVRITLPGRVPASRQAGTGH
jgi:signal transduction histidine kinase